MLLLDGYKEQELLQMTQTQRTLILRHGGAIMVLALALAFAACGGTANAAASATVSPACVTATARAKNGSQGAPQTVSGKIATLNGNALTVTSTSGKTTAVNLSSNTRISKITPIQASSLASGTTVIILTNPSTGSGPTTARSIIVQPITGGQSGTPTPGGFPGGFGGGRPGRNGGNFTPCRAGTGTGPRPGGLGGARGIRGTVTAYNASTQQLTITDAQGATYLIGVTSTTTIGSFSAGTASDLAVGETITVSGMTSGNAVNARTIQILSSATAQ
jgi:hypothetical protein